MGTIANAKVTHYYNCYNGDFIGCLPILNVNGLCSADFLKDVFTTFLKKRNSLFVRFFFNFFQKLKKN